MSEEGRWERRAEFAVQCDVSGRCSGHLVLFKGCGNPLMLAFMLAVSLSHRSLVSFARHLVALIL